ncbi:MAG: hypothetical protein ACM3UW_04005 [Bacillota bacterium]
MKPAKKGREDGAALLMIVIVTMVLLIIGTTMLMVNSSDSAAINPGGERPVTGEVPPPPIDPDLYYDPDFGWMTDTGEAYFDNNLNNVFDEGDTYVDVTRNLVTSERLIIPPSVGEIDLGNRSRTFIAAEGIYLGTSVTSHQGNSSLTLLSDSGLIKIANSEGANSVLTHFEITISNANGDIKVDEGVTLTSTQSGSKGNIILSAGGSVDIGGAILDAGVGIVINAGEEVMMTGSNLTAGGGIGVVSDQEIEMSGSTVRAGGLIYIESASSGDLTGAELETIGGIEIETGEEIVMAGMNLRAAGWTDIRSGTDIDIRNAELRSSGTITLTAGNNTTPGTISVNRAAAGEPGTRILSTAGQAKQAIAKPLAVTIDGTPERGSIVRAPL